MAQDNGDAPASSGAEDCGRPDLAGIDLTEALAMISSKPQPNVFPWQIWGTLIWQRHIHGEAHHHSVIITLRRNSSSTVPTPTGRLIGDSEIILDNMARREFYLAADPPVGPTYVELCNNEDGRLGAIILYVRDCLTDWVAFRVAQTVYNRLAVDMGITYKIPLRWACATVIGESTDGAQTGCAVVSHLPYPNVMGSLERQMPRSLGRLYSKFVEGLRTNSPFYSFLCFFALAEFLTRGLQGRLRRFADEQGIPYENLKGVLTEDEVTQVAPQYANKRFSQVLDETRDMRDATAHFFIEPSTTPFNAARPFNVAFEDAAMFAGSALKIICERLLEVAERNYLTFQAHGLGETELFQLFEGTA
jgi:hypothetical protein